jgi:hypothetical protein
MLMVEFISLAPGEEYELIPRGSKLTFLTGITLPVKVDLKNGQSYGAEYCLISFAAKESLDMKAGNRITFRNTASSGSHEFYVLHHQ